MIIRCILFLNVLQLYINDVLKHLSFVSSWGERCCHFKSNQYFLYQLSIDIFWVIKKKTPLDEKYLKRQFVIILSNIMNRLATWRCYLTSDLFCFSSLFPNWSTQIKWLPSILPGYESTSSKLHEISPCPVTFTFFSSF